MLLFFQNFKNIIKEKIQVIIFIILAALLAMVAIGSWNVGMRLQEGYNFMGQGTFDYNYLFKFGSKGVSQNMDTTISPSFAFDNEYHLITPDSSSKKDTNQNWTLPYWGIYNANTGNGALNSLKESNSKIQYVTNDKNEVVDLSINFEENPNPNVPFFTYEDNALFAFNYDSVNFQNSSIGKMFIYNKGKVELKNPALKTTIENYMNNFAYSVYGQGIIQIIINHFNKDKNNLTLEQIAKFINPVEITKNYDEPAWMAKNVKDSEIKNFFDVDKLQSYLKDQTLCPNLNGNFSFLAVQNQADKLNPDNIYNVFSANQHTLEASAITTNSGNINSSSPPSKNLYVPSAAAYYNNYNYGVFNVNDLYNVQSDDVFTNHQIKNDLNQQVWIGPYYLSTYYWDTVSQATNMKLEINQQYAIWDALWNQKLKIIDWKNLISSNRLRIIDKLSTFDPYNVNNNVQNSVYVVVTSSYAKVHKLKLGDSITVGNNPYLFVGAIGGDVTNIYPTIYDTDLFPDSETDGIIYVDDSVYKQSTMFDNKDITDTSTVFVTNVSGDATINGNNFINLLGADFKHLNDPLANNVNIISRDDSKIIYLRYALLGQTIFVYELISIILFIIFALILVFTISVLLKKIMDQEKVANGILKANGYENWKISLSYSPYAILLTLVGVPIGWGFGLIFEVIIMHIFNNYFVIPYHHFLAGYGAFGIMFVIIGILSLGSILFTAVKQLRVSPLQLISPHSVVKTSKFIDSLLLKIKFKSFWSRFNLTIFSVSYKQIIYFFLTFLAASVALTFVALLPTSINKIRSDYYKNLNYNNEYNYQTIVGNNPLTRYQEYSWNGPKGGGNDPLYPLDKNSLIPEYYANVKNNSLTLNWNQTSKISSQDAGDVNIMLLNNLLALRGSSFSIGTLTYLIDHYHNTNLTNNLYSLSCTFLPQLFHQPPINIDEPDPQTHIFTCINKALSPILPAQIKEQWSKDKTSEKQFNLTFGTTALDLEKEDLYTGYQSSLNNLANKSFNVYGINSTNKTIKLTSALKNKLNYSNNLINENAPAKQIENIKIPMVINDYILKAYDVNIGQTITGQVNVPTLEYTIDGQNYTPITQVGSANNDLLEGWNYLIDQNNEATDADLNNDNLSKFALGNIAQESGKVYGFSAGQKIKPYYNLDNIQLVLKADSNVTPASKFTTKIGNLPALLSNGDVVNITEKGSDKLYAIRPYSGKYDLSYPNIGNVNVSNWYREALATGLLKIVNVPKAITYQVIGVQNSYDSPRAFINQKLANAVLGYPIKDKFDISTAWFNGKFSQFLDETDQTTRYNLVPSNGSYTLADLTGNGLTSNFIPGISRTDYLGVKQQVINRVAIISMILTAVFILVIILTAVIIIYIITEGFVNKFLKFIAVMKALGYSNWEINRFILTLFTPFVLLAWLIGTFVMWWILKIVLLLILTYTSLILPVNFPWLLVPITLSIIIIIFAITFLLSKQKIINMSIQEQVNSNEQ